MNYLGQEINEKKFKPSPVVVSSGEKIKQKTLLRAMSCVGVALHSGEKVSLSLHPAEENTGIVFRRVDIRGSNEIRASWDNVVNTKMCTTISNDEGATVSTIEHLMSALAGCGIDNVLIDINGSEVPVMDGSAQPFVFLIECAGVLEQDTPRSFLEILKPVRVEIGNKVAELKPSDTFSVEFQIDFDCEVVSSQAISVDVTHNNYKKEIARARTFGFIDEVEKLRAAGLGLGGSLDNAVIVSEDKVLNEGGLRYADEFVRHKALDAIGDLYTCGSFLLGSYRGVRSGHFMTNQLLRAVFADKTAWRHLQLGDHAISESISDETENESKISITA